MPPAKGADLSKRIKSLIFWTTLIVVGLIVYFGVEWLQRS